MQWFYEKDGRAVGPVSRADMIRLIIQRQIHPYTLVWTPEFGDEWRPAGKVGLMMARPSRGKEGKPPLFEIRFEKVRMPLRPDMPGVLKSRSQVSSFWAWMLAVVPVLLSGVVTIVAFLHNDHFTGVSPVAAGCIYGISILALVLDRHELRRADIVPPSFLWWLFLPGYFWVRCMRLGRGRVLFLVCLLLLLAKAVVGVHLLSSEHMLSIGSGGIIEQTPHSFDKGSSAGRAQHAPEPHSSATVPQDKLEI